MPHGRFTSLGRPRQAPQRSGSPARAIPWATASAALPCPFQEALFILSILTKEPGGPGEGRALALPTMATIDVQVTETPWRTGNTILHGGLTVSLAWSAVTSPASKLLAA